MSIRNLIVFSLMLAVTVNAKQIISSYECEDIKRSYTTDTECCATVYDHTFDAGWEEQVANHAAAVAAGAPLLQGMHMPDARAAFGAAFGAPSREVVQAGMLALGYEVHSVPSSDGYDMKVFVANATQCSANVFLEYAGGGNLIGSPLLTTGAVKDAVTQIGGCHIVPYVRNLFDTPDVLYTSTTANRDGTHDDAVAAFDWVVSTYFSCGDLCGAKLIVSGASGGSQVALMLVPTVTARSSFKKVDMVVLPGPQLACDAHLSASLRRFENITSDWGPGGDLVSWSDVTDPSTQCPEEFPASSYAAFANRYFVAVSQHEGFFDAALDFSRKLWRANVPTYFVANGLKLSHLASFNAVPTLASVELAAYIRSSLS